VLSVASQPSVELVNYTLEVAIFSVEPSNVGSLSLGLRLQSSDAGMQLVDRGSQETRASLALRERTKPSVLSSPVIVHCEGL
jgi:hypothetical protein